MKMMSVWLTAAALLCHQLTAVAEPVTEKLFFNDDMPAEGSRRTVQAGEDVVLECEAAGRPSPTIYWQHKGVRLNPTSDARSLSRDTRNEDVHPLELGTTKARLYIDCARQSDAGLYTCVAETTTKRITTTTFLYVESSDASSPAAAAQCIDKRPVLGSGQRAARITMWTSMMLDFEGTNVVLFCRSEGNPRPTVTWIDPYDRHIDSDRDQYLITESGDLVIRDVRWSKNMGLYKCLVHNSHGSDRSDTFLYPTIP